MSAKKDNETKKAEHSTLSRRSDLILETSIDGFCMLGLDSKILEVNSSLCDILGYSREELLKMKIADIEVIETPEETAQHIDKIMRQGYDRFETKHRRKDGRIIHIEVSSQYCNLDDNKFLFSFFRDITDFWLSIDKLRKSHSVYYTLCSNIPGMVYRASPDWLTEFVSNSEPVCGYSPEDLKSNKPKWSDIIHPDDREMVLNEAPRVVASRSTTIQEYRIIAKDGDIYWVEDHKSPFFTRKGVFNGVDGIVFDITARKQTEKKLIESEHTLAMAQQAACVGSWDWDILNDKVTWSDETCRQMGVTQNESELTRETFSRFVHPDDMEQVEEAVRSALEEDNPYSIDARMIRKDGTEWIMHSQGIIQRNDDGKAVRFVGTQQDITERKKAQNNLQMERNKLDSIIGAMEDGLAIMNLEYEITYQNKAIVNYFGNQMGKKCFRVFEGNDQICDDCPVRLAFRDGMSHTSVREITTPSGETAFWENTANPIRDTSGKIIACLEICKNITERKRIEMEREMYRDDLLQAQKRAYIGAIGSIVAHQVNQPLTMISILLDRALEQIEEASCSPSVLKDIKDGLAEAQKAVLIIRKFRQQSKNSDLEGKGKVNVSAVADKITSALSQRAKQANILISVNNMCDLPEIESNETALEQMFLIIIQNAIEAADGRRPHKLDIRGKFADDNIELQFSDDCCGIAPENLDRIYDPFFTTKTESEGMGLGLDIVKQLLISSGGQIRVESQLGKGTTFYVTLPIDDTLRHEI